MVRTVLAAAVLSQEVEGYYNGNGQGCFKISTSGAGGCQNAARPYQVCVSPGHSVFRYPARSSHHCGLIFGRQHPGYSSYCCSRGSSPAELAELDINATWADMLVVAHEDEIEETNTTIPGIVDGIVEDYYNGNGQGCFKISTSGAGGCQNAARPYQVCVSPGHSVFRYPARTSHHCGLIFGRQHPGYSSYCCSRGSSPAELAELDINATWADMLVVAHEDEMEKTNIMIPALVGGVAGGAVMMSLVQMAKLYQTVTPLEEGLIA